jgi:hypothetical protein
MPALLSLEEAPPLSAPLRFFLTAPLFAIAAGGLLVWSGPDLWASRWTPAALALTHLITAGFMLQVMLGAMLQLLPVVAGANMVRPLRVATVVHIAITLGALCLVAAFLGAEPRLFGVAAFLMGAGVLTFVVAAARALLGAPGSTPIVRGLRLALLGLCVTVSMGLWLAVSMGWSLDVPLARLANIHLGWGLVGWGAVLLGAVGFVVVPMFQQTPSYPSWFERSFAYAALGLVLLWSVAEGANWERTASILSVGVVLMAAAFALTTFKLQRQRKRAKLDAVQRLWQLGMLSTLAACVLWLLVRAFPMLDQWQGWPLLFGVLLLCGGFMSVMVGMLYKIVPFLVWLHLQERGQGRLIAPNMKKVLAEPAINRQAWAHTLALGLLLLAVWQPVWLTYPAGLALMLANGWLLRNLLQALGVYRSHLAKIEVLEARQPPA